MAEYTKYCMTFEQHFQTTRGEQINEAQINEGAWGNFMNGLLLNLFLNSKEAADMNKSLETLKGDVSGLISKAEQAANVDPKFKEKVDELLNNIKNEIKANPEIATNISLSKSAQDLFTEVKGRAIQKMMAK